MIVGSVTTGNTFHAGWCQPHSVRGVAGVRALGEVRHFRLRVLLASEGGDPGPGLLGDNNEVKARPPLQLPEPVDGSGDTEGTQGQSRAGEPQRAGWTSMPRPHVGTPVVAGGGVERVGLVASGFARAAGRCPHPRGSTQRTFVCSVLRPEVPDQGTGGAGCPRGPRGKGLSQASVLGL